MKFISFAKTNHDLSLLKDAGVTEVIVSSRELGRYHDTNHADLPALMTQAKELGLKVVLEWNILINDSDFNYYQNKFEEIPTDLYAAVRVQDVGVLEYVLTNTKKQIQFITENGNHNLIGLQKWESYIGERLERLVLSIELSKETLKEYKQALKVDLELLVLGPVLLFYSPRKLLSPHAPSLSVDSDEDYQSFLKAVGESEESPHKGFPLVENKHGTFMFHIKDLFLMDKLDEISQINIDYARIDLRENELSHLKSILSSCRAGDFLKAKSLYAKDVIRGYFQINKSDVLFKKLKNYRLQRKDESYVGEVLEILKGSHLAVFIKGKSDLSKGDELKFITPEGKEFFCQVHTLKDINGSDTNQVESGRLALMNYMSGVWVKSQVYLNV